MLAAGEQMGRRMPLQQLLGHPVSGDGQVLVTGMQLDSRLAGRLESRALPYVAEPFEEIRDKWNRVTYRLGLDDGTDVVAHFTVPLKLGGTYLYFGSETNPRPVDPLIMDFEEIGRIP